MLSLSFYPFSFGSSTYKNLGSFYYDSCILLIAGKSIRSLLLAYFYETGSKLDILFDVMFVTVF
jgi:hypothetical protein